MLQVPTSFAHLVTFPLFLSMHGALRNRIVWNLSNTNTYQHCVALHLIKWLYFCWSPQKRLSLMHIAKLAREKCPGFFSSPQTFTRCLSQHHQSRPLPLKFGILPIFDTGSTKSHPPPPNMGFCQFWIQVQQQRTLPFQKNLSLCHFWTQYQQQRYPHPIKFRI